jgi:hypothetical protein
MINSELSKKAKLLLDSPHFTNHVDQGFLTEKQSIFLTLCGKKPVSEATSGIWATTANGGHSKPDDEHEINAFLSSLGLAYQLRHDDYATDALVALNNNDLLEYSQASLDSGNVGQLFGYPKTAVDAFGRAFSGDATEELNYLMAIEDQDKLLEKAGVPDYIPMFRFSRDHALEELEVVKDWYATLRMYNLVEE